MACQGTRPWRGGHRPRDGVAAKYDPVLINEMKEVRLTSINEKGCVEVEEVIEEGIRTRQKALRKMSELGLMDLNLSAGKQDF
jgi:hypothetical protein